MVERNVLKNKLNPYAVNFDAQKNNRHNKFNLVKSTTPPFFN